VTPSLFPCVLPLRSNACASRPPCFVVVGNRCRCGETAKGSGGEEALRRIYASHEAPVKRWAPSCWCLPPPDFEDAYRFSLRATRVLAVFACAVAVALAPSAHSPPPHLPSIVGLLPEPESALFFDGRGGHGRPQHERAHCARCAPHSGRRACGHSARHRGAGLHEESARRAPSGQRRGLPPTFGRTASQALPHIQRRRTNLGSGRSQ